MLTKEFELDRNVEQFENYLQNVYNKFELNGYNKYCNILLYGNKGTGKTRLMASCPKPVYALSFDPGGLLTVHLRSLIASGDIIPDIRFEVDDWRKPHSFEELKESLSEAMTKGLFNNIGTLYIDSLTSLEQMILNNVANNPNKYYATDKNQSKRAGKVFQIGDYNILKMELCNFIHALTPLPCHVICTGHLEVIKDDVTGKTFTGLCLSGKLSVKVPPIFDALWGMDFEETSKGINYFIRCRTQGQFHAVSRINEGLLETREVPDLKNILRKCGLSAEDKPKIILKEK